MAVDEIHKICTVVLHDDSVSHDDVLCGSKVLPFGCVAYITAPGAERLCIVPNKPARNPSELSIHVTLAQRFGFENRANVTLHLVEDVKTAIATHVELLFRDQMLLRADMWHLIQALDGGVIYEGQDLSYLGSTVATVQTVYISGKPVKSALVSHSRTKPIFRSGSSRYTILIQVSKEMLEFWPQGDFMYERLLLGFLPELFRRWDALKVHHRITVVLFGRRSEGPHPRDWFQVVATDISNTQSVELIRQLRRVFNGTEMPRQVSLAADGNMLEAIQVAASDYADLTKDPYLGRTGNSVIAVTAGSGLFHTVFERLRSTTLMLMGNSIGVDIVSLSPKPLHPVPLFAYQRHDRWEYALPHWVDISFWTGPQNDWDSAWLLPDSTTDHTDVALPFIEPQLGDVKRSTTTIMDYFDEAAFGDSRTKMPRHRPSRMLEDVNPAAIDIKPFRDGAHSRAQSTTVSDGPFSPAQQRVHESSITRAKRESLPVRPLFQPGRKISLGPKGLAPGRGLASTTLSTEHAHQGRETQTAAVSPPQASSSGLAKQIRQSLARKPSQQSLSSQATVVELDPTTRPINIDTGLQAIIDDFDVAGALEKKVMDTVPEDALAFESHQSDTPKGKQGTFLDLARAAQADDKPTDSPWVTLLNPCNPRRDNMRVASQYRKWQHLYPKAISTSAFKWSSMCTPAALPLTTEYRPSIRELEMHATKKVRRIIVPPSSTHIGPGASSRLLAQLISLRLHKGFQMSILELRNMQGSLPAFEERIMMSVGSIHHELQCLSDAEVQVVEYDGNAIADISDDAGQSVGKIIYSSDFTTSDGETDTVEMGFSVSQPQMDWAAWDERGVRRGTSTYDGAVTMRLVLIPVEPPRTGPRGQSALRELSDEEMRIDGIQKLTQLWQRHRHFSGDDQRHQASLSKPRNTRGIMDRDPNPLAVEYQTRDPSNVVNAYGPGLAGQAVEGEQLGPLFAESEMYHSSTFDVAKLVKQMQEAPPHGVEVRDRRWFTRLHLKCFRGDEMVNWLLRVFKDLSSREDAITLGNELMERGVFSHVRRKHEFRDGNYFYQITSAHRTVDYPDTASMFTKGTLRSVPPTPFAEARHSPMLRPAQSDSDSSGKPTPPVAPADRKEILLSQAMFYNVDPTNKSDQLEIVTLHYDRIHNPENCYHILLEWTNTTVKLIRDAVQRWASLVEAYGLRLVQIPVLEANKLRELHPFDAPLRIKLALRPPSKVAMTPILDAQSFFPQMDTDPLAAQKAILRRLGFLLDFEAAASFTSKLDVRYSWGPPVYELTQFVHKTGLVLAQISGDDQSDFILLPNRLAVIRGSAIDRTLENKTTQGVMDEFKAFCRDEIALSTFYEDLSRPRAAVPASPFTPMTPASDFDVPPMSLPPHLLHRAALKNIP